MVSILHIQIVSSPLEFIMDIVSRAMFHNISSPFQLDDKILFFKILYFYGYLKSLYVILEGKKIFISQFYNIYCCEKL